MRFVATKMAAGARMNQLLTRKNQQHITRQRRTINVGLSVVVIALLTWVSLLFYGELRDAHRHVNQLEAVTALRIVRPNNTLVMNKHQAIWQVAEPYQEKASTTVIEAFLQRLNVGCQAVDEAQLSRDVEFYATVHTNVASYEIGELNSASDRVYVKKQALSDGPSSLALCDKLVASIALAPAINFIDKQLFQGELSELRGSFGSITDFSGIDLSVLEVAPADSEQAQQASVSDLVFVSSHGQVRYRVLAPSDGGNHVLLFSPTKSIIYVIAAHPKINAILGL